MPTNETLPPNEEAPPPKSDQTTGTNDNKPPAKRPKGSNTNINVPPSPVALPLETNISKSTLQILPEQKCDPYPGIIGKKPTRRTSAQVAADKKQADELKWSLEELAKRKVEILAEIEVQQQINDEEEERQVIRTLADMEHLEKAEEFGNDGRDTEIESGDSKVDEDSGSKEVAKTQVPTQKVGRKKKPGKGETRAAVDVAKAEMKGKKRKSLVDLGEVNVSKESKGTVIPSGLVTNWKQKTATRKPAKAIAPASTPVEQTIGGLDNEDADTIWPFINIVSSSKSDSDDTKIRDTKKTKTEAKPKPIIHRMAATASTSAGSSKGKALAKLAKVKYEPLVVKAESIPLLLTTGTLDDLPNWAKASWSTSFLPTLYAHLSVACKPFQPYAKGSNLLVTIQEITDIVYLGSGYRVGLTDKIYTMAWDCLNKKHSYFGTKAIKVVKEFFKGDKYASNQKAITKYMQWATRDNGPGIFGNPAPIDSDAKWGHPEYIKGKDIFKSKFIIDLVLPFFKWCENSSKNYGRPVGALAMAAAGMSIGMLSVMLD
ncbi:hypothetical protein BJV74DRAFT_888022 [Russula compacta]|nr:hypothetical protein BJV74DRAFT_888022 [Russula compacta]